MQLLSLLYQNPISMSQDASPTHGRIPELDGFRAIAIWMVLLGHILAAWPTSDIAMQAIPKLLRFIISHGWLGVDLFFLLSGLLITGILIDSRSKPNYWRNFYARRTLRIVPLYLVCIAVFYFSYPGFGSYFLISLLFLSNFASAFGVPVPHGPGVFWSLAIEEHFYLLWPWLIRFVSNQTIWIVSGLMVVLIPVLRAIGFMNGLDIDSQIYTYSWFRWDGLALGAAIAVWMRSKWYDIPSAWRIVIFLLVADAILSVGGMPFGIAKSRTLAASALRYTQVQLVFAASIVLVLAYRATPLTAIFRSPFAVYSASVSYCVYLVHLAIGDAYYHLLGLAGIQEIERFGPIGSLGVRALVVLSCSFAVGVLSKKFLEDPILKLKKHF
jgi:peptidoglycan/LPS O-acetylase OafA/YrhL